jgi:hypothetical protein
VRQRSTGVALRRLAVLSCGALLSFAPVLAAQAPDSTERVLTAQDFGNGALILPEGKTALVALNGQETVVRVRFVLDSPEAETPGGRELGTLTVSSYPSERLLQRLPVATFKYSGSVATSVAFMDLNFDGFLDLAVPRRPNDKRTPYVSYVFEPRSEQFVADELTTQLDALGGLPVPDATRRELSVTVPSTDCGTDLVRTYRLEEGKLDLVREDSAKKSGTSCVVTTQRLVSGALQTVDTRSVPALQR